MSDAATVFDNVMTTRELEDLRGNIQIALNHVNDAHTLMLGANHYSTEAIYKAQEHKREASKVLMNVLLGLGGVE